jgi:NADPH:quinone reductase-like Zn-dependent oxidoreductase
MKAVICSKYGNPEVLEYTNVNKPTPKDNEVLIKILNASVSSGDAKIRSLNLAPLLKLMMKLTLGFKRPRKGILGSQFAGIIEDIGKNVSKFKKGDAVYGITGMNLGCYAQYTCLKENAVIVKKPESISFEEAVPIPFGAMTALHILRNGNIQDSSEVLIFGASGSVGTYAVQIAKYYGAKVTAVCSKKNFELMKSLGADKIIDYHTEDFTKGSQKYNVVFDAVGKIKAKQGKQALISGSKYLSVTSPTSETLEKLNFLNNLIEDGNLKTVIDKTFILANIQDAHRYVDTGHKVGNVIIEIEH